MNPGEPKNPLKFRAWPKIAAYPDLKNQGLHSTELPAQLAFKASIKLHGTNAGISTDGHGNIACQSRSRLVQPNVPGNKELDNYDFAKWVSENLSNGWSDIKVPLTVYGEFAGPGIIGDDAVGKIPRRQFFVFCVYVHDRDSDQWDFPARNVYWWDRDDIRKILQPIITQNCELSALQIIPEFSISTQEVDELNAKFPNANPRPLDTTQFLFDCAKPFNDLALKALMPAIEKRDPYIFAEFGISGPGEGLVLTPMTDDWVLFKYLMFKVKTPHHHETRSASNKLNKTENEPENENQGQGKNNKGKKGKKQSASAFAQNWVTPARCAKIKAATVDAVDADPDDEHAQQFVASLIKDVDEESMDDREGIHFEDNQVQEWLATEAYAWWVENVLEADAVFESLVSSLSSSFSPAQGSEVQQKAFLAAVAADPVFQTSLSKLRSIIFSTARFWWRRKHMPSEA